MMFNFIDEASRYVVRSVPLSDEYNKWRKHFVRAGLRALCGGFVCKNTKARRSLTCDWWPERSFMKFDSWSFSYISHRALRVVCFTHGIIIDAKPLGRGAELRLDLWQVGEPVQVAVAGQDEGAVVIDNRGGGAPGYKHIVGGVRHVPIVLNLQKK